ncbi:LacI family DNA-binding transcriptional regulator [Neptunicella marina]|uniref:LacI family DNA-binding transcriptional regulator n=1 Tax=Neptunicella marina TaxID=2125989 RepID=A0A8J6IS03_9ALTE|nr:LacI family DNA-binding transcriptional regulator [Neptunicella marina]MBC3765706.1 LacI family DNA-binding transcriptional regulator [Neptunicella marina]
MKSTIKDVAELAGVSIKTVSRVINQEGSVRADTLKKVSEAIATLNYQPNHAARNLAGTRSYALGYVYDNPNAYYVIDMQNGILSECREKGYELIIHPCNAASPNIVDEIRMMVIRSQLAGLIISPPLSEMPEVLDALEQMDVNFVRVVSGANEEGETSPCVFIHDHAAALEITEHLISLDHRKIAFISGDKGHRSTDERKNGYLEALEKHGITPNPDYIFEGQYSFKTGVEGAQYLLNLPEPPTAIFSCNDEIAAGALFAARLMGVSVPEKLSIAGFEDSPFSRQTWPKLTTAAQPISVIARKASSSLISHIIAQRSGKGGSSKIAHQHFQPHLVVRESTERLAE